LTIKHLSIHERQVTLLITSISV